MTTSIEELGRRLGECMLCDQPRLRRRLGRVGREGGGEGRAGIARAIERSIERRSRRVRNLPAVSYPEELPISSRAGEIRELLAAHPVIVVCGETGSGKSTQLPKICLEAGRGAGGWIGHTQPRRIAARSIASRIARELGSAVGSAVGYKIRFGDTVGDDTYVKVMTDGILLAEIRSDRNLLHYDTIIIDEAHERSLNIDFLLGYLKQLLPRRPDLRVIITSATIDPHRFSEHFGDAPIVEVSGRTYPVEVRYRPLVSDDPEEADRNQARGIVDAVAELSQASASGDILVFLSGEREIRETARALRGRVRGHGTEAEVLPLYARLSAAEQDRVFRPHPGRRIVLATNVAETSLTVPGIRYVIDPGDARVSRYSRRSRVQRLEVEPISQASAAQRAGRCGRLSEGVCIRLYGEQDFEQRDRFTTPEILRSNLASVILQMKAARLGEPGDFPFLERPKAAMIRDGYGTLHELGAVDDRNELTEVGRALARLPIDPSLGRMILEARQRQCLAEILPLVAVLSLRDPRERPMDQREQADQKHRTFADEQSDFIGLLNLWHACHREKERGSWNRLRAWCHDHYVSFLRIREWQDLRRQLADIAAENGWEINRSPASYEDIHIALLSGLLGNIGYRGEGHEYCGTHDSKFFLFPGSALFSRKPEWIVAAEIVQTTKRYARTIARIRPEWVEPVARHLVKRSYNDPRWHARSGRVMADERVTLYGLELVARRRIHYGPIDPPVAREIFIRHALVEGDCRLDAPFVRHNRQLIEEVRAREAKQRRRDLLIDDDTLFSFFDARVPADAWSVAGFERWRRKIEKTQPRLLFLSREDVLVGAVDQSLEDEWPDVVLWNGHVLRLSYQFEPGEAEDGITVTAPLELSTQLRTDAIERRIPGLLREKIVALIRGLPKEIRRNFVPVPDWAERCLPAVRASEEPIAAALGQALEHASGVAVPADAWDDVDIPAHLRVNLKIVDPHGEAVAAGRDADVVRRETAHELRRQVEAMGEERWRRDGLTDWDFDELPEAVRIEREGLSVEVFPMLVDRGESVSIRLATSAVEARRTGARGALRLFMLRCRDELTALAEHIPSHDRMCLLHAALGHEVRLTGPLLTLISKRAFYPEPGAPPTVRSRPDFTRRLEDGWNRLWAATEEVSTLLLQILEQHQALVELLAKTAPPAWRASIDDIESHRRELLKDGFLDDVPFDRLRHFPRYVEALLRRREKLAHGGHMRDRQLMEQVQPWTERLREADARRHEHDPPSPGLEDFRWMLEELRVSLFAQELGTAQPVSLKRMTRCWESLLRS